MFTMLLLTLLTALQTILSPNPQQIAPNQTKPTPPNIIFILLDDVDYTDFGAYGSADSITPHIDKLAKDGMKFTQFYANAPVCSPTRVSVLTGRYPTYLGFDYVISSTSINSPPNSGDRYGIPASMPTTARLLKSAGYTTAHFDKWHVGLYRPEFNPIGIGFDHEVRLEGQYTATMQIVTNESSWRRGNADEDRSTMITNEAINFITQNPNQFFVNLWYFMPHDPLHVPPGFDNSCCGFDLTTNRGKYLSMLYRTDEQIGRLLAKLDELNLSENTVVILASDNGGWEAVVNQTNRPLSGYKHQFLEGGIRVPMIARWPNKIAPNTINDSVSSTVDLYPTFAEIAGQSVVSTTLDGTSLLPTLLNGETRPNNHPIFWQLNATFEYANFADESTITEYAVRSGNWKLIHNKLATNVALYDLSNDLKEQQNLASVHPKIAEDLVNKYREWRIHNNVPIGTVNTNTMVTTYGTGEDRIFSFKGQEPITVTFDSIYDNTGNTNFSLVTQFKVEKMPVGEPAIIARRENVWELLLNPTGELIGRFYGYDRNGTPTVLSLQSPPIAVGVMQEAAMTVLSYKNGEESLFLYLNDKEVGTVKGTNSIVTLRSNNNPITLGTNFQGLILLPKFYLTTLWSYELAMITYSLDGMPTGVTINSADTATYHPSLSVILSTITLLSLGTILARRVVAADSPNKSQKAVTV